MNATGFEIGESVRGRVGEGKPCNMIYGGVGIDEAHTFYIRGEKGEIAIIRARDYSLTGARSVVVRNDDIVGRKLIRSEDVGHRIAETSVKLAEMQGQKRRAR